MYAPTWEGENEANNFSSVDIAGPGIVRSLLAVPATTVLYKPHPRTPDSPVPQMRAAHRTICDLLDDAAAAEPSAGHRHWEGEVLPLLARADLLVADVSSVTVDHLYLRPDARLVLMDRGGGGGQIRVSETPVARSAVVVRADDIGDLTAAVVDLLGSNEQAAVRRRVRHEYFGDFEAGESTRRFQPLSMTSWRFVTSSTVRPRPHGEHGGLIECRLRWPRPPRSTCGLESQSAIGWAGVLTQVLRKCSAEDPCLFPCDQILVLADVRARLFGNKPVLDQWSILEVEEVANAPRLRLVVHDEVLELDLEESVAVPHLLALDLVVDDGPALAVRSREGLGYRFPAARLLEHNTGLGELVAWVAVHHYESRRRHEAGNVESPRIHSLIHEQVTRAGIPSRCVKCPLDGATKMAFDVDHRGVRLRVELR